jgi:hypothetical protein
MAHPIVCTMQPDLSLMLAKRRFVKPGSIVRVIPQQPSCNLGQRENVKLYYAPHVSQLIFSGHRLFRPHKVHAMSVHDRLVAAIR